VKRLLVLSGLVLTGLLAMTSVAQAHDDAADCDGTATGLTIRGDLNVPSGGSCQLINTTVRGDVKVRGGGYFEASNTTIRGDVKAKRAETVFIEGGSTVRGNVEADRTSQVFLFASTIGGNIEVERADDKVNVCGITVQGGIEVEKSSRDILVGDPLTTDCAGNVVKRGDIEIQDNDTDVELVVRGNTIKKGDLVVKHNTGTSDKIIDGNTGGDDLICKNNASPFTATANTGWDREVGQCDTP
jgi:hypothetical protein